MTRLLVLVQSGDAVVQWTVDGLAMHRRLLRKELGVELELVEIEGLDAIEAAIDAHHADAVVATSSWRLPAEDTIACFRALYERPKRPWLVYYDTFDPTSSPYFGLLPWVDRYAKKQLLVDVDAYQQDHAGGFVFSDFMARHYGHALDGWHFGSRIPAGCADRLVLGWSLASARHLVRGATKTPATQQERDIDVHCRLSFGPEPESWYAAHRRAVLEALAPLGERHRVIAAGGDAARVPYKVFHDEMERARIGFSPFGWGEVTDRDFHIVNQGALLMKPDMSHLRTDPDIYSDGETYVAVRWDLADVAEKVEHYLARPEEAQRIVEAARRCYAEFTDGASIVSAMRRLLP